MDEGFGVSMMSADITTATWGGSTQPSSTQNDSAVSADDSDEEAQRQNVRQTIFGYRSFDKYCLKKNLPAFMHL